MQKALWGFLVLGLLLGGAACPGTQTALYAQTMMPAVMQEPTTLAPEPRQAPSEENPILTRADAAHEMLQALAFTRKYVSVYPTYRDVGLTHPYYVDIETLRLHGLMDANDTGFFEPEREMSRMEAFYSMYRLLRPYTPDAETADNILSPFTDFEDIPRQSRPILARLVLEGIIRIRAEEPQLRVDQPIKQSYMVKLVRRAQLKMYDYQLARKESDRDRIRQSPLFPANMNLVVTPSQALVAKQLNAGERVYFLLSEPVTLESGKTFEQGSRLAGVVKEAQLDANTYGIQFKTIRSTGEVVDYRIAGELDLYLPEKPDKAGKMPFVVTGDTFELTTKTPEPDQSIKEKLHEGFVAEIADPDEE